MTKAYLAAISKEANDGVDITFCSLHDDKQSLNEKIKSLDDECGTKSHKIVIAKLVSRPDEKVKTLQELCQNKKTQDLDNQYVRVSPEEVKLLFSLMDQTSIEQYCETEHYFHLSL